MIFAVIDTNVFVSGLLNPDNPPGRILKMVYEGKVAPVVTDDIFDEISRVLNYERFKFSRKIKSEIMAYLKSRVIKTGHLNLPVSGVPEDDLKFVIAAYESKANLIVTGNVRHFKAVADKIAVLTPAEFVSKAGYI